ncbi:transcription initiation factor TFIID subunit 7 [Phlebotomus argentipes]|uniref:transcription initiation factor TFIID subunit 7 n=1 Tax=Phlebotomus argentipes TaxID=94469 RepID=UPI0028934B71|nr:transcription initiation factor TFIID subunit 7 [Phlebotomus argentipes]
MHEKAKHASDSRRDDGVELETQLILRIPEEPAKALREAIQQGANNLKDRLNIRLENDIRYGEVRFDNWYLYAKVVDLPTVIESLKTIDNKSFYKTADICQMMICKFEPELPTPVEEESPNKNKKKDPNKVDKKFLWPHGVTPPCKNIRKRRFRKTLKKKYVEAPEIEKEVKRLLRSDNDAVSVKYEIINEEEERKPGDKPSGGKAGGSREAKGKAAQKNARDAEGMSGSQSLDVGEHDIFGGEVSSSEDEDNNINVLDLDENSRLSADDSRLSDSNSMHLDQELSRGEFNSHQKGSAIGLDQAGPSGVSHRRDFYDDRHDSDNEGEYREGSHARISELRQQLDELRLQRMQKEQEISSIENQTLRQRMQDTLDSVVRQIHSKELEVQELEGIVMP